MINKFDETQLEQAFIELLTESNYIHSKSSEISRDISNVLIEDDLKKYLINKYDLSNYQIENIQNKLKNISSSGLYKANKEIHKLITSGFYIKNDNDDERTFVQLVDNENFENNIFRLVISLK